MIKYILLIGLCFGLNSRSYAQPAIYISPGFGLGLDLSGNYLISLKMSIGRIVFPYYANVTIGYSRFFSRATGEYKKSRLFVEPQIGDIKGIGGAGAGISIPLEGSNEYPSLRFTCFGGFIAFMNSTILLSDTVQYEFKGEIVLPIPIYQVSKTD